MVTVGVVAKLLSAAFATSWRLNCRRLFTDPKAFQILQKQLDDESRSAQKQAEGPQGRDYRLTISGSTIRNVKQNPSQRNLEEALIAAPGPSRPLHQVPHAIFSISIILRLFHSTN